ncbi:MAG TPA: class I SAM-dependent methyltransferase [Paracoccaceae bacterium]|nr:class I SAM-dependent methyltransferase [Paracoccaceae bacterium]HMO71893.1 class I SAM-dependent methyltransferase [Paracoccaceae bacterium]
MRLSHAALIRHEERYPTGHRDGYAGFSEEIRALRESFYAEFLESKTGRQPAVNEVLAAFDDLPPEEFARPYAIDPDDLAQIGRRLQRKYVVRFKNIRRSWAILLQHMPELMSPAAPRRAVLEMSTAHGATLEILRHKGHRVRGNDFPNFLGQGDLDDTRYRAVNEYDLPANGSVEGKVETAVWPYEPIIASLNLQVDLFDGGALPYPYDDLSFDCVICLDALEHYCHPADWMAVIDEFGRLARESVLVITNPVQAHNLERRDYMEAFDDFQRQMRSYDRGGMRCVHAGINRHQLTVFKLMRVSPGRMGRPDCGGHPA